MAWKSKSSENEQRNHVINQTLRNQSEGLHFSQKTNKKTKKEREAYFDSEVGRENPGEGIVLGGALPGGALGGVEERGAQLEGAIDEESLIGVGGVGVDKALEGEVDGEGGG